METTCWIITIAMVALFVRYWVLGPLFKERRAAKQKERAQRHGIQYGGWSE